MNYTVLFLAAQLTLLASVSFASDPVKGDNFLEVINEGSTSDANMNETRRI